MQHLSGADRQTALSEMRRILQPEGTFYIAWIRNVPVVRGVRRLLGRSYHVQGRTASGLYLDRFSPEVLRQILSILPEGHVSYSETLFHPDLRIRSRAGWLGAIDLMIASTPLAAALARQAEVAGRLSQ